MFPLVYEINTRIWLRRLSLRLSRPITLLEVPDEEIAFFRNSGFDIVWLMGVWEPSQYSKAAATTHPDLRSSFLHHIPALQPSDIGASPYAIPSYTVNASLGGREGLEAFRQRLRAAGIRLMLDFVPNHLALDNRWLPSHPEYFIQVSPAEQTHDPGCCFQYALGKHLAYGKDPFFPPWTDTLQLNYANPATRAMMTENLLHISELCDAVRCDVAMLVLKSVFNTTWKGLGGHMKEEFWAPAIARVRERRPDFLFLAESYWNKEWELQQQGFDFTYDKPYYDYICSSPVNVDKLKGHMQAEWEYQKHLCRFLENHDEERAAEKLGLNNRVAAMAFMASPGMHLVHQNQMEGFHRKIPVQLLRQAPEHEDRKLSELYTKLFSLQSTKAFQEGRLEWLDLPGASTSHCFAFLRHAPGAHALLVANFSGTGIALEFDHPALQHALSPKALSSSGEERPGMFHLEGSTMQVRLSAHEGLIITF